MRPAFKYARVRRCGVALVVTLALAIGTTGCQTPPIVPFVKDFQTATAVAEPALETYFLSINRFEREALIDDRVAKRTRIDLAAIDESKLLTTEDLAARISAVQAMLKYANLLAKLASTNVAQTVSGSVDELNTSLVTLNGDLGKLTGRPSSGNEKFSAVSGAFAGVAKQVADMVLKGKVDSGLTKAIRSADGPIRNLVSLLKEDLRAAAAARRSELSAARVAAVDDFNDELKRQPKPDGERLTRLGNAIKNAEERWELVGVATPLDLLDRFATAHAAMVMAVEKPDDIPLLVSAANAIDGFTSSVKAFSALADALNKL